MRRRSRVAGRQHPGCSAAVALEEPPPSAVEVPVGEELPGHSRWRTAVRVALIAVVLAALGMGAWLHGETDALRGSAATSNRALLDRGPTAEVSGQVRDAVERVFSYDFARLDDNECAAAVITGRSLPTTIANSLGTSAGARAAGRGGGDRARAGRQAARWRSGGRGGVYRPASQPERPGAATAYGRKAAGYRAADRQQLEGRRRATILSTTGGKRCRTAAVR
ncbi:MAG TPA: hypothetical protein VE673_05455 [Pseudonocardiaceae bacterium]|nr:hypothetical protein [Pseudonocardiaceae bacterium]